MSFGWDFLRRSFLGVPSATQINQKTKPMKRERRRTGNNKHLPNGQMEISRTHTRWAPSSYKWSYGAPIKGLIRTHISKIFILQNSSIFEGKPVNPLKSKASISNQNKGHNGVLRRRPWPLPPVPIVRQVLEHSRIAWDKKSRRITICHCWCPGSCPKKMLGQLGVLKF